MCLNDISFADNVLRFRLRVTKGNKNWNHCVQLAEDLSVHEDLNFFKWFRLFLQQKGLLLENFDLKNKHLMGNDKLFRWTAAGAREIFAKRV